MQFFSIRNRQISLWGPDQARKKMGAQNQSARPIGTQLETLLFAHYLPK